MTDDPDYTAESHTLAIPSEKMRISRLHKKGELIPVLTVIDGPRIGSNYRFTKSETEIAIGRVNCEFVINDETVSRRHAQVTYVNAGGIQKVVILDLDSTNGTFVNGQQIKRAELKDGARIQVGNVLLRYELLDPIDAKYITDISRMIKASEADPLTGLYTRKYMDDEVAKVISYLQKRGQPLCLLMVDLDHFKSINDRFGHPVGDEVLRRLGKVVRDKVRGHDIPIRYGGEEIAVFLPGCDLPAARTIAERLRMGVELAQFDDVEPQLAVTVSIGLTCIQAGDTVSTLISRADEALYDAKRDGRNCLRERE